MHHRINIWFLQSRYNQQLITSRELQQKINFQSVEIETFKRQLESIQMVKFSASFFYVFENINSHIL